MNIESTQNNNIGRKEQLARDLSVVTSHYDKGNSVLGVYERETIDRIEKNKGEIGGRTALVAEFILRKHITGLEKRNREIKLILNSSDNFNRASLDEEIESNEAEINMIESNCLNTLGKININL